MSIITDSRLEYSNELLIPGDKHQDLSLSNIDPSLEVSRTDNRAFEPFEVNVYHKNRKTCQDIMNESMEHQRNLGSNRPKRKHYRGQIQ